MPVHGELTASALAADVSLTPCPGGRLTDNDSRQDCLLAGGLQKGDQLVVHTHRPATILLTLVLKLAICVDEHHGGTHAGGGVATRESTRSSTRSRAESSPATTPIA